jgi:hypothetical protein
MPERLDRPRDVDQPVLALVRDQNAERAELERIVG